MNAEANYFRSRLIRLLPLLYDASLEVHKQLRNKAPQVLELGEVI